MSGKLWRFEQLGGDRRVLVLAGWSAPFGRPRGHSLFRERVEIAEKTVRYPGSGGPPTRHVFHEHYEPWELTGRFMDREGGPGYAIAKAKEVADFVRDKQEVRVSWGDIVSCDGFLKSFEAARESEAELEWKLVVLIDEDNLADPVLPPAAPPSPRDTLAMIENALRSVGELEALPSIRPSVLDTLSSAISAVGAATGALASAAAQLQSFEQALAGELQRLRAVLGQARTAVLTLRSLVATTRSDSLTLHRSFTNDVLSGGFLARLDVDTLTALAGIERLDGDAELALHGKLKTSTVARRGDTWESIATRSFGGPDKADELRRANGVRYGEAPQPGRTYQVPIPI